MSRLSIPLFSSMTLMMMFQVQQMWHLAIFKEAIQVLVTLILTQYFWVQAVKLRTLSCYRRPPASTAGDSNTVYNDTCFPPSLGTARNDMGAFGGLGACGWPGSSAQPNASIAGHINYTLTGNPVPGAALNLTGATSSSESSDAAGDYLFQNLLGDSSYTITAAKTGDLAPLSITCFDAVQIALDIVGKDSLTVEEQKAADVDENSGVDMMDAALDLSFCHRPVTV